MFPAREEALAMLESEGCGLRVIEHCEAVEELALKMGQRIDGCNLELVSRGALLHDIGRSVTHDIWHVVRSAEILKCLGVDDEIVEIARRHVGAGLTAEEVSELGFPPGEYMPETVEQKVVAHADNLVGTPDTPGARRTVKEAIVRLREAGQPGAAERVMALHNELSLLAGIDIDEL